MKAKLVYSFIVLLLMINFVSSAPVKFMTSNTQGCEITPVIRETLKTGQNFDFNFHVFNISNGYPLTNASLICVFHLYNQTGDHLFSSTLKNDPSSEHNVSNEWAERLSGVYINTTGNYAYIVQCNGTIGIGGCADKGSFYVSSTSQSPPTDNIIIFFSIIFILSIVLVGFFTLYTFGHLLALDFDIIDLSIDWGIYFGIVAVYFLEGFYLGNDQIGNWLLILIKIGGFILILVPIIAFILSITIGTLQHKGVQQIKQPRRFRWRR